MAHQINQELNLVVLAALLVVGLPVGLLAALPVGECQILLVIQQLPVQEELNQGYQIVVRLVIDI